MPPKRKASPSAPTSATKRHKEDLQSDQLAYVWSQDTLFPVLELCDPNSIINLALTCKTLHNLVFAIISQPVFLERNSGILLLLVSCKLINKPGEDSSVPSVPPVLIKLHFRAHNRSPGGNKDEHTIRMFIFVVDSNVRVFKRSQSNWDGDINLTKEFELPLLFEGNFPTEPRIEPSEVEGFESGDSDSEECPDDAPFGIYAGHLRKLLAQICNNVPPHLEECTEFVTESTWYDEEAYYTSWTSIEVKVEELKRENLNLPPPVTDYKTQLGTTDKEDNQDNDSDNESEESEDEENPIWKTTAKHIEPPTPYAEVRRILFWARRLIAFPKREKSITLNPPDTTFKKIFSQVRLLAGISVPNNEGGKSRSQFVTNNVNCVFDGKKRKKMLYYI